MAPTDRTPSEEREQAAKKDWPPGAGAGCKHPNAGVKSSHNGKDFACPGGNPLQCHHQNES